MSFTDVWFGFSMGVGLCIVINEILRYLRHRADSRKLLVIREHLIDLRNHLQEEFNNQHAKH